MLVHDVRLGCARALGALVLALWSASAPAAAGDVALLAEAGPVGQTRNDFRIPGDGGTLVELAEVDSGPFASFRATLTWDLTERQSLRLLAAPLTVETAFTPASTLAFQDLVVPAGQPTQARYVFNSYRLSWYRRFAPGRRWSFRLGATLKVRDAEIGLSGASGRSVKDDLGVVPLLYTQVRFQASERLAIEAEADALAAPQGRAEDVSVKGVLRITDAVDLDVGYRLLEGGADNEEVFSFAFFHYAVAGLRIRF